MRTECKCKYNDDELSAGRALVGIVIIDQSRVVTLGRCHRKFDRSEILSRRVNFLGNLIAER